MTSERPNASASAITSLNSAPDPGDQSPDSPRSFSGVSNTPSVPSDADWLSPFTLPPLPALRRNSQHSARFSSPEQGRKQSRTSTAYYAAAWGSPYATPSPDKPTVPSRFTNRSLDFGSSSPLRFATSTVRPASSGLAVAHHAFPLRESSVGSSKETLRSPPVLRRAKSERPNWLSDSEGSGTERPESLSAKTPTKHWASEASPIGLTKAKEELVYRQHRVNESVATITPDTFHDTTLTVVRESEMEDSGQATMDNLEQGKGQEDWANDVSAKEKPLPHLPPQLSENAKADVKPPPRVSPPRPRMPSTQSFQRPKRKVVWNGKTCIIALPLADREDAGLPPLLTMDELRARLQNWITAGYDIHGFTLSDAPGDILSEANGQSRAIFPDTADIQADRTERKLKVRIPDQAEWDAWVEYLKEEKLRALGVTPSTSDAPPSTHSPFSSVLSRSSSRYRNLAPSPPIPTSSAASNAVRISSSSLSPAFNSSTGLSTHAASVASSQYGSHPGSLHTHKLSTAYANMQARGTSPLEHSTSHPNSVGRDVRSPANTSSTRHILPSNKHAGMKSLGEVLSPVSAVFQPQSAHHFQAPSGIDQMRRQQQELHARILQQQQQQQQQLSASFQKPNQLPHTPVDLVSRTDLEIAHPTPRSHRHNLSMALQREIDDAEAAVDQDSRHHEHKLDSNGFEVGNESVNDDLPILQRPEPLADSDRSEVETNPSIAASPLLADNKHPFGHWQATTEVAKQKLLPRHTIQPSLSKLNVKAPAFDPQGGFFSSNFAFGGSSFQPRPSFLRQATSTLAVPDVGSEEPSLSKLNVEAPAFRPLGPGKPDSVNSSFKFTSATFNVKAPEFNPITSGAQYEKDSGLPPIHKSLPNTNSIFGEVIIDPLAKAVRRSNKAVPISTSTAHEDDDESEQTDGEGRPTAPAERQKRARRASGDRDRVHQHADSATSDEAKEPLEALLLPKSSEAAMADRSDVSTAQLSNPVGPRQTQQSGSSSDLHLQQVDGHEKTATPPAVQVRTDSDVAAEAQSDSILAGAQNDDPDLLRVSHDAGKTEQDEALGLLHSLQVPERTAAIDHESASSLSALAKPFEFRSTSALPAAVIQQCPPIKSGPRKSLGLEASRFAPMPQPSSPAQSASDSSPPRDMYEYIKAEDPAFVNEGIDSIPVKEEQLQSFSDQSSTQFQERAPKHLDDYASELDGQAADRASAFASESVISAAKEAMPSYEEIDAVMKQFEDNPDLGIERNDTPIRSTPLVDMRLASNIRSDAPSPSHGRTDSDAPGEAVYDEQFARQAYGLGIGGHKLLPGTEDSGDWNIHHSPNRNESLEARAQVFDDNIDAMVEGILASRLGPMTRSLEAIEQSMSLLMNRPQRVTGRRSMSTEARKSDADDEDDYDAYEGFSSYRSRSPGKRRVQKQDRIKAAVIEALSVHQSQTQSQPQVDMSEIHAALVEMKQHLPRESSDELRDSLKAVVEDVIATNPRLRSQEVQQDLDLSEAKYRLEIDGLEFKLKTAAERAEQDACLLRKADEDLVDLQRRLRIAEEEIVLHQSSSSEAQQSLIAFVKEKEAYRELDAEVEELNQKNTALENTLEEYRASSDQWRDEIRDERARGKELNQALHSLQEQLEDRSASRQVLRAQTERLHERMRQVVEDVASEQAEWRKREHELVSKNDATQAALDREIRHQEKMGLEFDELAKEHKLNVHAQDRHVHAQREISRMEETIAGLRGDRKAHEDSIFRLERQLSFSQQGAEAEVAKAVGRLQVELESANAQLESLRSDSDAQIDRLQRRLDHAELDVEDQKAQHDTLMAEISQAHSQVLREANEKRESVLEEQHSSHERKLTDLRERHTRALHNSSDDRHRLEYQLNERLALSEDKVNHLESKVGDLEERLEITKSAARAAVQAATSRGIDLPTPAPSVVASPPSRVASASMHFAIGSDLPDKISPQALRESILVLQDQLQHREQTIEKLEADLAAIDKDAPETVKARDVEISWLRELLSVRIDDLDEIIATLAQPAFDREATKDAAIRLKANLQMEQQLKERAAAGLTAAFPLLPSSLASLTQSPRALPLAAAAAWGNWRKARDTSISALSDMASNLGSQTPSKSSMASSQSFLAGIMTPPSTNQRTPPERNSLPAPPSMRPLAAAVAARKGSSSEARPLRAYNSQPRALSSRQAEHRPLSFPDHSKQSSAPLPSTPLQERHSLDLGEDVDEDASPFSGQENRAVFGEISPP